jgi:hypothetical protein
MSIGDGPAWTGTFRQAFGVGFGVQPPSGTVTSKALRKHRALCDGNGCVEVQCDRGELWRIGHDYRVIVVDGVPKLKQDRTAHETEQQRLVQQGAGQPKTPGPTTGREEQGEERAAIHVLPVSRENRVLEPGQPGEAERAGRGDQADEANQADRQAPGTTRDPETVRQGSEGPGTQQSRKTAGKTGQSPTGAELLSQVRGQNPEGMGAGDGEDLEAAFTAPVKSRAGRKRVYANATERKRAERARRR